MKKNSMNFAVEETQQIKTLKSENYNYVYNKWSSVLLRWGKEKKDNPAYAPFGPEYAYIDVEDMSMELLTVVLSLLTATQSLALVIFLNVNSAEQYSTIQDVCKNTNVCYNLSCTEDKGEGALFSLYVDNKGAIKPYATFEGKSINVIDANNLMTDVWMSNIFKSERWKQLQCL